MIDWYRFFQGYSNEMFNQINLTITKELINS